MYHRSCDMASHKPEMQNYPCKHKACSSFVWRMNWKQIQTPQYTHEDMQNRGNKPIKFTLNLTEFNCKYLHFTNACFCKSHSILQGKLFITILVTVNIWPPLCDRNYEWFSVLNKSVNLNVFDNSVIDSITSLLWSLSQLCRSWGTLRSRLENPRVPLGGWLMWTLILSVASTS